MAHEEELEALKAIYEDKVTISSETRGIKVDVLLDTPETSFVHADIEFVLNDMVSLEFQWFSSSNDFSTPTSQYISHNGIPIITLTHARGLSEESIQDILSKAREKAKELISPPMIFDLIVVRTSHFTHLTTWSKT
jgi:hypothetical protein